MHIHLWEWDRNIGLVKGVFHLFPYPGTRCHIVFSLYPTVGKQFDGRSAVILYQYFLILIRKYALLLLHHLQDQPACLFDIRLIRNAELKIQPSLWKRRKVCDRRIGQFPVLQRDPFIIRRPDSGADNIDTLDRSLIRSIGDIVSYLKCMLQQDHHASRKIGQTPLQSQPDHQRRASQQRKNRGGFDT